MKTHRVDSHPTRAFTLTELVVVLAVVAVLLVLVTAPEANTSSTLRRAKMTEALANARSLQQATQMMTLDSQHSGKGLQWTCTVKDGIVTPVSLDTYLKALTDDGYLTASDLRKLLTGPGRTPAGGRYTANDIAFTIYAVSRDSPPDQVFLTSANLDLTTRKMIPDAPPWGDKGFIYFTKGGGGGIRTRPADATGPFPDGPGYRYIPLK